MTTGYRHCECRDCFEIALSEFCTGCEDAGCPDYQGQPRMSQECQRDDAYGDGNEDGPDPEQSGEKYGEVSSGA